MHVHCSVNSLALSFTFSCQVFCGQNCCRKKPSQAVIRTGKELLASHLRNFYVLDTVSCSFLILLFSSNFGIAAHEDCLHHASLWAEKSDTQPTMPNSDMSPIVPPQPPAQVPTPSLPITDMSPQLPVQVSTVPDPVIPVSTVPSPPISDLPPILQLLAQVPMQVPTVPSPVIIQLPAQVPIIPSPAIIQSPVQVPTVPSPPISDISPIIQPLV